MFVITIPYKKATVAQREQLVLSAEETLCLLQKLASHGISEAIYLCTCNRCELYGIGSAETALTQLSLQCGADLSALKTKTLIYEGEAAIRHLFRVTAGMESMVLGEDEILGQMRDAYEFSRRAGFTNYFCNTIFQAAFTTVKRIKTETLLSKSSVSVATIAADYCRKCKEGSKRILVIGGSGDTGRKLMQNLQSYADCSIFATVRENHICNHRVIQIPYAQRYDYLEQADVVISATKSPHYTITKYDIAKRNLTAKPRLFLDLAVPRDIDRDVAQLEKVTLLNIDEIEQLAQQNNRKKQKALLAAEELLEEGLDALQKELLFHQYFAVFERRKEKEGEGFAKFVYEFRDSASAGELEAFLQTLQRMEEST